MLFTPLELLDIVLMTLIVGYLFKDAYRHPVEEKDLLDHYRNIAKNAGMAWHDFWWACALIAPSIILHEMGHKFLALGFGLDATFHAACSTADLAAGGTFFTFACNIQIIAIVMKAMGFGFLLFIPGYVSIAGGSHLQQALIALMGPLVHLIIWLSLAGYLRDAKRVRKLKHKTRLFLFFVKQINLFLFVLNMIPIPGFDGFWVFYHLIKLVLGT